MTLRLRHVLFLGIASAAVATACGIKLDETAEGENPEAQCLELFETCVELAGTSQGCEELYSHCEGSVGGTEGVEPPEGCEQDYIDCLAQGGDAISCEPLLDVCSPGTGDTGGCDPLDPDCVGETSIGPIDTGDCPAGDEACPDTNGTTQCDSQHEQCLQTFSADGEADPEFCGALFDACIVGDCDAAVQICTAQIQDPNTCQELTGCDTGVPPGTDCDQLLADCESQGVPSAECANLYPEYADCDTGQFQCDWYFGECAAQFSTEFCNDGGQACDVGWLPDVFECAWFFPDACETAGLLETACSNAETSCHNGFSDAELCAQTSLADDPYQWLNETAECNNWNQQN